MYEHGEWTYAIERSWRGASARDAERRRGRPVGRLLLTGGAAALVLAAAPYELCTRLEALAQVLQTTGE